jgi:hypothetical protein
MASFGLLGDDEDRISKCVGYISFVMDNFPGLTFYLVGIKNKGLFEDGPMIGDTLRSQHASKKGLSR